MATTQVKNGFQGGSDDQLLVNPDGSINVNSSGSGGNASVGVNTTTAPTSSTQVGGVDPNGNLEPLQVNSSGELIVAGITIFTTQDVIVNYNEVTTIAVGIETVVNTYVAPSGKTSYLLSILASGGNRSKYNVYNNGVAFDTQYTQVTQLSAMFDYKTGSSSVPGKVIPIGNTVEVKVLNSGTSTADFNARFLILEVT